MKKLLLSITALLILASCKPSDEQVEKAVAKYIESHPELFETAQQGGQKEASPEVLKKIIDKIVSEKHHPVIGDANSKDLIIEFYDYNCGYCKKSLGTILKLANEDKAKVILVELPVLGEGSAYAAHASLAVNKIAPDKFVEFHSALMNFQGHANEQQIINMAQKVGVDKTDFDAEMAKTDEYIKILQANTNMARGLKIGGTPSFIVNGEIVRGAVPYEAFKQALKK